jgi:hypothetical protein
MGQFRVLSGTGVIRVIRVIRGYIRCILTWCENEQPRHSTGQIARPVSTLSAPHSGSKVH